MIYIVTNRNLVSGKSSLRFGGGFNSKGPNELRLGRAHLKNDDWVVTAAADKQQIEIDGKKVTVSGSEACFLELQERMKEDERDCVFFIHGYNNSFKQALKTAGEIQDQYNVEVVMFSWPANGGGGNPIKDAHGYVSYKWDKRDAANSIGALDRVFELLGHYLSKHREVTKSCNQNISLLCHSMGNYLLKKMLGSKVYSGGTLLFDNVVLASADANNADHVEWVNKIAHRKNLYITINENDFALAASRFKMGDKQRARLGHYTRNLTSDIAVYLDFTETPGVGRSHSYFSDDSVNEPKVQRVFDAILKGRKADSLATYNAHTGAFDV